MAVLMRTDPFRELDRLTQQMFGGVGTTTRPSVMPMDAWRDGDVFVLEFDLPGIDPATVDLDVERNVLTIKAERPTLEAKQEVLAAERPRGVFSRQLVLGRQPRPHPGRGRLRQRGPAPARPGRRAGQAPQDHHQLLRPGPAGHHRLSR